jgi:hypothetical protein
MIVDWRILTSFQDYFKWFPNSHSISRLPLSSPFFWPWSGWPCWISELITCSASISLIAFL